MSLQVWLPLDGNLNNQGLASCSVTAGGGVSVDSNGPKGHKNYAFNGTQSANIIGTLNIQNNSSIGTLMCWVNIANFPTSGKWRYIMRVSPGSSSGYAACTMAICLQYTNQIAIVNNGNVPTSTTDAYTHSLVTNKWYHLAQTFDGTTGKLYINGIEVYSNQLKGSVTKVSYVGIGCEPTASDWTFSGKLYDARYYDNVLTIDEIRLAMSGNLLIHYPLNGMPGDSGTIEYDISGNHNDAIIYGIGKQGLVQNTDNCPRYNNYYHFSNKYLINENLAYSGADYSISIWYMIKTMSNGFSTLFSWNNNNASASGTRCRIMAIDNTSLRIDVNGEQSPIGTIAYTQNQWHHICLTANTTTIKIYQDNQLVFSKASTPGITPYVLALGASVGSLSSTIGHGIYDGNLSDFRFYTKCLTADEVSTLYHMGV